MFYILFQLILFAIATAFFYKRLVATQKGPGGPGLLALLQGTPWEGFFCFDTAKAAVVGKKRGFEMYLY